jgi:hypothetical protein
MGSSEIQMDSKHHSRNSWVRVLALALAVFSVLVVAQVLFHSHAKGQNEATCQVCQTAHFGSSLTAGITSLVGPLFATGYVQPFVVTIHQEFFFHDSPSRAPPSA